MNHHLTLLLHLLLTALPLKIDEFESIVQSRRNAFSPGINQIPYKVYKKCPRIASFLFRIFCSCQRNSIIPVQLGVSSESYNSIIPVQWRVSSESYIPTIPVGLRIYRGIFLSF